MTGKDSARICTRCSRSPPYVLLVGASLGGAIPDIYAARYPKDVAGMIVLDSTLPDYLEMYRRFFPRGAGPQPESGSARPRCSTG